MLKYNSKTYQTRKELKQELGGTAKYNEALKQGKIIFIN